TDARFPLFDDFGERAEAPCQILAAQPVVLSECRDRAHGSCLRSCAPAEVRRRVRALARSLPVEQGGARRASHVERMTSAAPVPAWRISRSTPSSSPTLARRSRRSALAR